MKGDGRRQSDQSQSARRHDLDALRAIAMLLGIVLHAALSFSTVPWTVSDSQTSETYTVLFALIHGFRMPLFFLLSGFFTAMLWRKRSLKGLIRQRVRRILLPLVFGTLTIVPAMWAVSHFVTRPSSAGSPGSTIYAAVVSGDREQVRSELQNHAVAVNTMDPSSGSTPLCTAVFIGRTTIAEMLINAGADVDLQNRDKASPLHIAAFMGRATEFQLLLDAGANVNATDGGGKTPEELLGVDFGTTNFIASSLGVSLDRNSLLAGRQEITTQLGGTKDISSLTAQDRPAVYGLLFQFPLFMHLWFLAFLCWLIPAFLVYALVFRSRKIGKLPRWLICSPVGLVWLVPLTMLPQSFMATGTFGPDSSIGLLPMPSVLAYYAIFFFFGAIYWEMDDSKDELGQWWFISLPVALLVIFPVALDQVSGTFGIITRFQDSWINELIGNFLEATFTWLMVSGSIGLCRRLLSRENETLRYLSDSSYWLYLVHLPLVILAQWLVRDLQLPAILKVTGIIMVVSSVLLLSYQFGVRYTAIGRLLNGPRRKRLRTNPTAGSV